MATLRCWLQRYQLMAWPAQFDGYDISKTRAHLTEYPHRMCDKEGTIIVPLGAPVLVRMQDYLCLHRLKVLRFSQGFPEPEPLAVLAPKPEKTNAPT